MRRTIQWLTTHGAMSRYEFAQREQMFQYARELGELAHMLAMASSAINIQREPLEKCRALMARIKQLTEE